MSNSMTRGVLFVHSAPPALGPHIEWAVGNALGYEVAMAWTKQDAAPGMLRSELTWSGEVGTGARLASALRGWQHLRYEVTEEGTSTTDAGRWAHTPELGIFHSQMDKVGNTVIPEDRVRSAIANNEDLATLREALDLALGQAWDDELEPFRYAGAGVPVRWLHQVG